MKKTLEFILQSIVDHPDEVVILETKEESRTIFTIQANAEDLGKVIGKSGRIIRAIRDLIKLMAAKENVYVDVIIEEENR